jgi:hypothetical protein
METRRAMTAPVALAIALGLAESNSPVQGAYAYSRATTPGIPPGEGVAASPQRAISTSLLVYVVLRKGTDPSSCGLWLRGAYYSARLQKVASPVTTDANPALPTGQRETLVPKTASDVYRVSPTGPKPWAPKTDADREAIADNEVVVFVQASGATWHGTARTVKVLNPEPGQ